MRSSESPVSSDFVCVGLGGNVGAESSIEKRFTAVARLLLAAGVYDLRCSRLYRSAAAGAVASQPDFLNAALAFRVPDGVTPDAFLHNLWRIERHLGRKRPAPVRGGPRRLDLDILLWRDVTIRTPALEVPHPRLLERAFALAPLRDVLGPDAPVAGTSIESALERTAGQRCQPIRDLCSCPRRRVRLR